MTGINIYIKPFVDFYGPCPITLRFAMFGKIVSIITSIKLLKVGILESVMLEARSYADHIVDKRPEILTRM